MKRSMSRCLFLLCIIICLLISVGGVGLSNEAIEENTNNDYQAFSEAYDNIHAFTDGGMEFTVVGDHNNFLQYGVNTENELFYVYPIVPNNTPDQPVVVGPGSRIVFNINKTISRKIIPVLVDRITCDFSYSLPYTVSYLEWRIQLREINSDEWVTIDQGGDIAIYNPVYKVIHRDYDLTDPTYANLRGRSVYEIQMVVNGSGSWSLVVEGDGVKGYSDYVIGNREPRVNVGSVIPLEVNDNNVGSGFMATLDNGDILHVFSYDFAPFTTHPNDPAIYKRKKTGGSWGPIELIYNSETASDADGSGEGNVNGGITEDGKIVIFFRTYQCDLVGGEAVPIRKENYFMYSDDNGLTWTKPPGQLLPAATYNTGQMFYIDGIGKYCMLGYNQGENKLIARFSEDGSDWTEYTIIDDLPNDSQDIILTEIAGAYCKDGRIICLVRDEAPEGTEPIRGDTYLQYESYDNGQTWSGPFRTDINIIGNHWACAPQLIYDEDADLLILITSDRRSYYEGDSSLPEERMYIYTAKSDEAFGNPKAWCLEYSFLRPSGYSAREFYGYAVFAKNIFTNEYNIVFIEDKSRNYNGVDYEELDFYEFTLSINEEE